MVCRFRGKDPSSDFDSPQCRGVSPVDAHLGNPVMAQSKQLGPKRQAHICPPPPQFAEATSPKTKHGFFLLIQPAGSERGPFCNSLSKAGPLLPVKQVDGRVALQRQGVVFGIRRHKRTKQRRKQIKLTTSPDMSPLPTNEACAKTSGTSDGARLP